MLSMDRNLESIIIEHGKNEAGWDIEDVRECVGRVDTDIGKYGEIYDMVEALKSIPEFAEAVKEWDVEDIYAGLGSETFAKEDDNIEVEPVVEDTAVTEAETVQPELVEEAVNEASEFEPEEVFFEHPEEDEVEAFAADDVDQYRVEDVSGTDDEDDREQIERELNEKTAQIEKEFGFDSEYSTEFAFAKETLDISREMYIEKYGEEVGNMKADQFRDDWFEARNSLDDPDKTNEWAEQRLKDDGLDSNIPDVEKVLDGVDISSEYEEPSDKDTYREKAEDAGEKKGHFTSYHKDTFTAYYDMKEKYYAYKADIPLMGKDVSKMDIVISGVKFLNTNLWDTLLLNGLERLFEKIDGKKEMDVARDTPNDVSAARPEIKDMGLKDIDGAYDNGYAKDVDHNIVDSIRHSDNPDYGRFYGADVTRPVDRFSTDNMNVWTEGKPYTFTVQTDLGVENIKVPQMRMVELDHNFYQVDPFGKIEASKIMDPGSQIEVGSKISSLDVSRDKRIENALEQLAERKGVSVEELKGQISEDCKRDFADRIEVRWEKEIDRLETKIEDTKQEIADMKDRADKLDKVEDALRDKISVPENADKLEKVEGVKQELMNSIEKAEMRQDSMEKYKNFIEDLDKTAKIDKDSLSADTRFTNAVAAEDKAVGRAESVDYTGKELDDAIKDAFDITPVDSTDQDADDHVTQPDEEAVSDDIDNENEAENPDADSEDKTGKNDIESTSEEPENIADDVENEAVNTEDKAADSEENRDISGKDAVESNGSKSEEGQIDSSAEDIFAEDQIEEAANSEKIGDAVQDFLDGDAGFDDIKSAIKDSDVNDVVQELKEYINENYDNIVNDDDVIDRISDLLNDLSDFYDGILNDICGLLEDGLSSDGVLLEDQISGILDEVEPLLGAEETDPLIEMGEQELLVTDDGLVDMSSGELLDSEQFYDAVDDISEDICKDMADELDSTLPDIGYEAPDDVDFDATDAIDGGNIDVPKADVEVDADDFLIDDAVPDTIPDGALEEMLGSEVEAAEALEGEEILAALL